MPFKLGRRPVRHDHRTLCLEYYTTALLPAPASCDWSAPVANWPMYLNNQLRNCTIAAAGHMIEAWDANSGNPTPAPTDTDILAAYEEAAGYNPADPATDQGAVELDVLNYWRQTGIAGHRIGAYAAVNARNPDHVRLACWLFGGLYIGIELPDCLLPGATVPPWVTPDGQTLTPNPDNGHAINVVAYDASGLLVVTWGQTLALDWATWAACVTEAYALISSDWIRGDGQAPSGLDMDALRADLQEATA